MFRTLRLLLVIVVPALAFGVPLGLMLGNYARGETPSRLSGYSLPDQGAQDRSATSADAIQPAAVAYTQHDRYADAAAHWLD